MSSSLVTDARRARADRAAVAQDREGRGHRPRLLEEVADVDDGDARRRQPADRARRAGRRPRAAGCSSARPSARRGPAPRSRGRSRPPAARRSAAGPTTASGSISGWPNSASTSRVRAARLGAVPEAAARRLGAHQDVLGHREVGEERQLLVDERDPARRARRAASGARRARPSDLHRARRPARGGRPGCASSVLLPAPFSPRSACTSPGRTSSDAPSSATRGPEALDDAGEAQRRRVIRRA